MQYSHDPGPNPFDLHWRPRLAFASDFLRTTQDRWLTGDDEFPIDKSIAVILNVFTIDFHAMGFVTYRGTSLSELGRRSQEDWYALIGAPIDECSNLLPRCSSAEHEKVVRALRAFFVSAICSWERNPGEPTTDELVDQCAKFLSEQRYVTFHR